MKQPSKTFTPEISRVLELYEEADNLAKDLLIKSWKLKNEDKQIARLYYQKACRERQKLAERLVDITKGWELRETRGFERVGETLIRMIKDGYLDLEVKNES
ncbi:MAG: hypothetical protein ABSC49_02760 [Candidatus Microgenomates bacterium]|jgi:hypothetical protein